MEKLSCSKCKYLDRYYTKGVKRFNRTEFGWCKKKRESVNVRGCCEMWQARTQEYDLSQQRFDSVQEDIKVLLRYLD